MTIERSVPASEPITRVEFVLSNRAYPFVGASAAADCEVTLEEIIPRGEAGYAEFFEVRGTDPEPLLEIAADHGGTDARLLEQADDGLVFEFVVDDDCPAMYLGERGALPREVRGEAGEGRIVAEVPHSVDADALVERFLDDHPDAELVDRETTSVVRPMFAHRTAEESIEAHLDDTQRTILEAADEGGYYEWPRETDAAAIASDLDLDPDVVREQLRRIEQKLIVLHSETTPEPNTDDTRAQTS